MIIYGAPVEYTGPLADLNARGVSINWRRADEGGFIVHWRSAADGRVTTYHLANARVRFAPQGEGFIIVHG